MPCYGKFKPSICSGATLAVEDTAIVILPVAAETPEEACPVTLDIQELESDEAEEVPRDLLVPNFPAGPAGRDRQYDCNEPGALQQDM